MDTYSQPQLLNDPEDPRGKSDELMTMAIRIFYENYSNGGVFVLVKDQIPTAIRKYLSTTAFHRDTSLARMCCVCVCVYVWRPKLRRIAHTITITERMRENLATLAGT